ncbi:MAG: exodeoxyribonuclease III [Thermoguttaceae bacterium]
MKIATWNVNSIRARQERLLAWLQKAQPDVVCLQELKATDDAFPYEAIRHAGYRAVVFGQKTYNGVAILSRDEPLNVQRGIPGFEDPQARLLLAEVNGIWMISAYVPNGESVESEKYRYKLQWFQHVREFLEVRFKPTDPVILCGDFNVARDEKDVARPDAWAGTVLYHREVRDEMENLLTWGFVDVFRRQHPEGGLYSWWDYRMLAFPKNDGLRLDYVLATAPLAGRCTAAEIDRDERKGEKPSDHAPVITVFEKGAES